MTRESPTGRTTADCPTEIQQLPIRASLPAQPKSTTRWLLGQDLSKLEQRIVSLRGLRSQGKSWLTQKLYDDLMLERRQAYLAGQREIVKAIYTYIRQLAR